MPKRIRFEREAFMLSVSIYPLVWQLSAYYVEPVLSVSIGPLMIEIGNPIWLEELDEDNIEYIDDYRPGA